MVENKKIRRLQNHFGTQRNFKKRAQYFKTLLNGIEEDKLEEEECPDHYTANKKLEIEDKKTTSNPTFKETITAILSLGNHRSLKLIKYEGNELLEDINKLMQIISNKEKILEF
ncbi:hypothetical protein CWI36_1143p0010 [Hamiltosporidium magnivora]|uniref:Uncharacterized protein n=1 Tax=Hamiltosporidium magnivora TaxID=148818 RepID=A0A4Q9L633_9MICR|nr:hypothetical protein CWI36_1143p0010 [Hamiltosporidium magnivora]